MRTNLFWIGYVLGTVMVALGIAILTGFMKLRFADGEEASMLRTIFGIVLLLYGVYRFALTDMQRRRAAREDARERREAL